MNYYGLEWRSLDTYMQFKELPAAPGTPQADEIRIYAKDNGSGVSTLCYKNDAGTEICLPTTGPLVTGTGTANHLAMWSSATVLTDFTPTAGSVIFGGVGGIAQQDNANFFWDDTNNRLGIGTAAPAVPLDILATSFVDGAVNLRCATSLGVNFKASNSVGSGQVFVAGAVDNYVPGTVAGDGGVRWTVPNRFFFGTASAARFVIGASGEWGIGNAAFGAANSVFTSNGTGAAPSWNTTLVVTTVTASGLTQGSVVFAGAAGILSQDNAHFFWDDTNDRLGIGTASPASGLHLSSSVAAAAAVRVDRLSAGFASYTGFRLTGSASVADAGQVFFGGGGSHDGTAANAATTSLMGIYSAETWTSSAKGSYITLETTPLLSVTRAERFRVGPSGQWGIGGATYGSVGSYMRSGGASAAPVWSTLILPNAATANRIVYASATDTYGESANLAYDGTDFLLGSGTRARMSGQNRFRFLNSMARVFQDTGVTQSINSATITTVAFDGEDIDTDAIHDTSTNNSRLTAKLTGKYLVFGMSQWGITFTGEHAIYIAKNGGASILECSFQLNDASIASHNNPSATFVDLVSLVANDYLEMQVWQVNNTAGALDLVVGTNQNTHFGMVYMGE